MNSPAKPSRHSNPYAMDRSRQHGLGFFGYLFVAGMVVLLILFAMRIIPHYTSNRSLNEQILRTLDDAEAMGGTKRDIRKAIERRLELNNLYHLDVDEILTISKSRDGVTILVDYEVREHLSGNVDLLLQFEREFQK